MAKIVPLYSPKETYMNCIARANHNILKRVISEIQNQTDNEQQ